MKKIIYKIPSRGRPVKLLALIENIRVNAVLPRDEYHILCTLDSNDFTSVKMLKHAPAYDNVTFDWGHSNNKIAAFNRNVPLSGWELMVCPSDDIWFSPAFDELIWFNYQQAGPDTAHHYPDGAEHGLIWTVPILDKAYYDRFGYVYHPAYMSLFCDEEAVLVGQANGRMWFWDDDVLTHMHPMNGFGKMDAQYKYTQSFHGVDKRTFADRKRAGFPALKTF